MTQNNDFRKEYFNLFKEVVKETAKKVTKGAVTYSNTLSEMSKKATPYATENSLTLADLMTRAAASLMRGENLVNKIYALRNRKINPNFNNAAERVKQLLDKENETKTE